MAVDLASNRDGQQGFSVAGYVSDKGIPNKDKQYIREAGLSIWGKS